MFPVPILGLLLLLLSPGSAAPAPAPAGPAGAARGSDELLPPFRIEARGEGIDVEGGHAAPFLADLDGDGLLDLLVGQFGQGRLRLYPNRGAPGAPRFEDYSYLRADELEASVPYG